MADDTGDGLSAATAKKNLMAAWTVFTNGSWTAGDQFMLAGTGGRTYTDDGSSVGWFNVAGFSATYPTAVLCYDPASPADSTKYGRLLGQDRPRYFCPTNGNIPILGNATEGLLGDHGNFVVQGLIVDAQDTDSGGCGTAAKHDGVVWQNCQFKQALAGNNNASSPNGKTNGTNYSKCSFYGMWQASNGNSSGLFNDDIDGLWVQDCVFVHCGWRMGSSRDDDHTLGGTAVFGHSNYYAAGNINGHFDRNVYIDSASDGWGLRGSAAATQLVSIDEPIVGALSGYSSSYLDNPAGSVVTVDDFVAFGGCDIWSATAGKGDGLRGQGSSAINARIGSHLNNGVMFDNPMQGGGNQFVFAITNSNNSQIDQVVNVSNVKAHNYSNIAESRFYLTGNAAKAIINWSNCLLDTLTGIGTGGTISISGTGVRTWTGGDYPNALTRAQVITALGFSTKADMVNAMLEYPHLAWSQAVLGICFPAYGVTAQYATASVPSIAGLPTPTAVYKTALNDLSISTLSFTRGTPSTALLSGCSANFVLSSADLPAGFTITGRTISYDGSGSGASTPTIHILETNNDGAGTHTTPFTLSIASGVVGTTWAANADFTLSNGSLTALRSGTSAFWGMEHASAAKTNGNVIFNIDAIGSAASNYIGFDDGSETANLGHETAGHSIGWKDNGDIVFVSSTAATAAPWTTGDKLEIDKAGAVFTFYKWSGGVKGSALATIDTSSVTYGAGSPPSGSAYPSLTSFNATGLQVTADFSAF